MRQILAALKAEPLRGSLRSALTAPPVCPKEKHASEGTKNLSFPFPTSCV
jgi:hypothetical protein